LANWQPHLFCCRQGISRFGLFGAGGCLDLLKRLAFHVFHTGRNVGEELQIVDVGVGEGRVDGCLLVIRQQILAALTAAIAPVLADIIFTFSGSRRS
jgi:hypothetical protein